MQGHLFAYALQGSDYRGGLYLPGEGRDEWRIHRPACALRYWRI
jgi:hypothetical protein